MALKQTSAKNSVPAIEGENTAGGDGVVGTGRRGVVGFSPDFQGVFGHSGTNAGIVGESDHFHAVFGISHDVNNGGVYGANDSVGGFGLIGVAKNGNGIGVSGESPNIGVRGTGRQGVVGLSTDFQGVYGHSVNNAGIVGEADHFHAVYAVSHDVNSGGVFAMNDGGGFAGVFAGRVTISQDLEVHGDIKMMNADVAEEFAVATGHDVGPGSVVVLDDDGNLVEGSTANDPRVVGVVSGAGRYRPAIVLDRSGGELRREPVALLGKVVARADASYGEIRIGDLLTTSPTPGAAMRVSDHAASAGAVIGKALAPLGSGVGFVPVLVNLR